MKKHIVGLVTALALSLGLVTAGGLTAAPANAAPCPVYTGCTDTRVTQAAGPKTKILKGDQKKVAFTFKLKVKAVGSNVKPPKGNFYAQIVGRNKTFFRQTPARGGSGVLVTPRLPKGKYTVRVRYNAKPGTAFNNSDFRVFTIVVKRRRN
jgi:hypothetical protein